MPADYSKSDIPEDFVAAKKESSGNLSAGQSQSKRRFISKTVLTCLSIISTAEIARRVSFKAVKLEIENSSLNDIAKGDSILENREYVVMTDNEKQTMITSLVDKYNKPGK